MNIRPVRFVSILNPLHSKPDKGKNNSSHKQTYRKTDKRERTNVGEGDAQHGDGLVLRILRQMVRAPTQHRLDLSKGEMGKDKEKDKWRKNSKMANYEVVLQYGE